MHVSLFPKSNSIRKAGKIDVDEYEANYQRAETQRPKSAYDDIIDNHSHDRRSNRSRRLMEELNNMGEETNRSSYENDDQKSRRAREDHVNKSDNYNEEFDFGSQIAPRPTTATKLRASKSFAGGRGVVVSDRTAVPDAPDIASAVRTKSGRKKATLADLKKTSYKNIDGDNAFLVKSTRMNNYQNVRGGGETTEASEFFTEESLIVGRVPKQVAQTAELVDRSERGGRVAESDDLREKSVPAQRNRHDENNERQQQRVRRTLSERDNRAERTEKSANLTERFEREEGEERIREENIRAEKSAEKKQRAEQEERRERGEKIRAEKIAEQERRENEERIVRVLEQRAKEIEKAERKREKEERKAELEKIESLKMKNRPPESQTTSET
jgi:hypothetical protein